MCWFNSVSVTKRPNLFRNRYVTEQLVDTNYNLLNGGLTGWQLTEVLQALIV